jgi:hypothetical protein
MLEWGSALSTLEAFDDPRSLGCQVTPVKIPAFLQPIRHEKRDILKARVLLAPTLIPSLTHAAALQYKV